MLSFLSIQFQELIQGPNQPGMKANNCDNKKMCEHFPSSSEHFNNSLIYMLHRVMWLKKKCVNVKQPSLNSSIIALPLIRRLVDKKNMCKHQLA
jgi:hypothetical protein